MSLPVERNLMNGEEEVGPNSEGQIAAGGKKWGLAGRWLEG